MRKTFFAWWAGQAFWLGSPGGAVAGDFNLDGKTDMATILDNYPTNSSIEVSLSTGNGLTRATVWDHAGIAWSGPMSTLTPATWLSGNCPPPPPGRRARRETRKR
jgi:hypothetical protein